MAADCAAARPRDADIPLTDARSARKPALARPPPTHQTAAIGVLNEYGSVAGVHAKLLSALGNANDALRNSGIENLVFSPRGPELLPDPPIPPGYARG